MSDAIYDITKFAAILIAVGIICFTGYRILSKARAFGMDEARNMERDATIMEDTRYTQDDGAHVTGAEVVSVLSRMEYDKIRIQVEKTSGTWLYFNYDASFTSKNNATRENDIQQAKDSTDTAHYINPTNEFKGEVVYDTATGRIKELIFTL